MLDGPTGSWSRSAIGEHLEVCAGCRGLVREISEFYRDLDEELRSSAPAPERGAGRMLAKRARDLAVWEERLAVITPAGGGTPAGAARRFIRRHPIAAVGGSFALACVAGLGLLLLEHRAEPALPAAPLDRTPAVVSINSVDGSFVVLNGRNEKLWSRPITDFNEQIKELRGLGRSLWGIYDFGADGVPDVLTTLHLDGIPAVPRSGLHVFDGAGRFRDVVFERHVAFRGVPYEMPVRIQGNAELILPEVPLSDGSFFVHAGNNRSPDALLRVNPAGEVIGEYWHHGHLAGSLWRDVDRDGRAELILFGINDVDDDIKLSDPVIAVLDPERIAGRTESRLSRGYGHPPSQAERWYIRLPISDVNAATNLAPIVRMAWTAGDTIVFSSRASESGGVSFDLDYVFTASLKPLRVVSTTPFTTAHRRLLSEGKIRSRLDDAYLENLRAGVRFWDGSSWRNEPTPIRPER